MERHARDFMEAAKKLQLHFISLQREDQPTQVATLEKVICRLLLRYMQISSSNMNAFCDCHMFVYRKLQ